MDIVDTATRSRMMAGIKGKHTKPELLIRSTLTAAGYRYRLHRRDLPGSPDLVVPSNNAAIFVHGCFWHLHQGCRFAKWPTTRPEFWRTKLEGNVNRDADAAAQLNLLGWRVLVVWECGTRAGDAIEALRDAIVAWLEHGEPYEEIGEDQLHRAG